MNAMNMRQETVGNTHGDECLTVPDSAFPHAVPEPLHGTLAGRSAEVPVGYTRTDVGVIPSDWEVKRLGDIALFYKGSSLSKADLSIDGNRRCIHYGELFTIYGESITEVLHGTDRDGVFVCSEYNDVLMPTSDVTPYGLATASCILHSGIILGGDVLVIRTSEKVLNGEFLAYVVRMHRNQVLSLVSGTTVFHLYGRDMATFRFAMPSVSEQSAIAEALSDTDGLLKGLEALIAKKRAVKQAVMQQLLTGKTRLPGFCEEWETTTLGDIADIYSGATPNTQISAYWSGRIPWCTPTDITAMPGKYLRATERSVTEEGLTSCAARLLPVGTLLLCSRATIGEIKISVFPVCTNQGFKSLVCKTDVSNEFLYYLISTLQSKLIERALGSTFLEISKSDLSQITLRIPTYTEQQSIAEILSDLDNDITTLEHRRNKTLAVKQGMIQQLLTGRVRLVKPVTPSDRIE